MTMPAGDPGHEPFWKERERRREAEAAAAGSVLAQVEAHLGKIRGFLLAPPVDDVLFSGVVEIGSDGTARLEFKQPFASAMVLNSGAHELTLLTDWGGSVPKRGAGMARVPSGYWRLVALRGAQLVVAGTSGTLFDLEVYLRHRSPGAGTWS